MKQKNKKEDFLGTIGASLVGNILEGKGVIQAVEETIRRGEDYQCRFIL